MKIIACACYDPNTRLVPESQSIAAYRKPYAAHDIPYLLIKTFPFLLLIRTNTFPTKPFKIEK